VTAVFTSVPNEQPLACMKAGRSCGPLFFQLRHFAEHDGAVCRTESTGSVGMFRADAPAAGGVPPGLDPPLASSFPRTSTWLLTYFVKSDRLPPSSLYDVEAPAVDVAAPGAPGGADGGAPPGAAVPLVPVPRVAFARTKPDDPLVAVGDPAGDVLLWSSF
jgi:hypothetical protein